MSRKTQRVILFTQTVCSEMDKDPSLTLIEYAEQQGISRRTAYDSLNEAVQYDRERYVQYLQRPGPEHYVRKVEHNQVRPKIKQSEISEKAKVATQTESKAEHIENQGKIQKENNDLYSSVFEQLDFLNINAKNVFDKTKELLERAKA